MMEAIPEYLGRWTFNWKASGYHLSARPEVDLLSPEILNSSDPWVVLAAILERAKIGDFKSLPLLVRCISQSDHPVLWRACFDLMGDAGPSSFVRNLLSQLRPQLIEAPDPDYVRHTAYTLHESHLLWSVPILLDFHTLSAKWRDMGILSVLLSRLLEPEFGPIAEATLPDTEYRYLVLESFGRLRDRFQSDNLPVLYGDLFSVQALAERLYHSLLSPEPDSIAVLRDRQFFEASTGIDCSAFFTFGELDAKAAVPIVEDFLLSGHASNYKPGTRYFFGHALD